MGSCDIRRLALANDRVGVLATGGVEKVYTKNTVTDVLTVGEVRNLTASVENVV